MPYIIDMVSTHGILSINIKKISGFRREDNRKTRIFRDSGDYHDVFHPYDDVKAWIDNFYKGGS